jgi:chemosensory pili system protein ChpA (sensor histidine kinase/response regulator)
VATVQRTLQRTVEATEDDLIAQARQTRELQRDLLRTRMVEFEGISDRLYRVVRQASKDTGKQVKLDLLGGTIEMDRGMLDRMTPAFEHLLRNCVAHGIESADVRLASGKDAAGLITVHLRQEGNDVSVDFSDDGAGLNLSRIREKALSLGMIMADQPIDDKEAANLIFMPGFSTATQVTELAGRGIGMDVVRSEVNSLGGRIETTTVAGQGTHFKLILPLTTAVTQVVMMRAGNLSVGVPANVVETVRRATAKELQQAYNTGLYEIAGETVPFFWSGALLQASHHSSEPQGKTTPVVVFRSAAQRIALHVDEVLGNQEVVVKNLGPQLSRLPGLAGMSVLASGAVVLIYNPVALSSVYGEQARAWSGDRAEPHMLESGGGAEKVPALMPTAPQIPLILVVDDSITVRRVTQRLLQREGFRPAGRASGSRFVGHRDATHGRVRSRPQHPGRRAPAQPADHHDHVAHRREAPRACQGAWRGPLPRQALQRRRTDQPAQALLRHRDSGVGISLADGWGRAPLPSLNLGSMPFHNVVPQGTAC